MALAKERYEQAAKHYQVAAVRMRRARLMYVAGAVCWTLGVLVPLLVLIT